MTESIQPLRFDIQQIGKHVKSSKKRFTWIFNTNNRTHTITLDYSYISNKIKLIVDHKILLQSKLQDNTIFQHPFTLDGFAINILQQGNSFQLRINNKVFSHLYHQLKTNNQFKKYQDQIQDIQIDDKLIHNFNKNVIVNLNNVMGNKKKNKIIAQSQNCNHFNDNQLSLPSYFTNVQQASIKNRIKQEATKTNLLDLSQETSPQKYQKDKPQEFDFFAQSSPNNQTQSKESTSPSSDNLQPFQQQQQQQQQQQLQQQTNKDDLIPLQNILTTINIQNSQPPNQQQTGLDLLESISVGQQPPNNNNFDALQSLLSPQNQSLNSSNPTHISGTNVSTQPTNTNNQSKITNTDPFSIQNIFSTISYGYETPSLHHQSISNETPSNFTNLSNKKQFNSMQNISSIYSEGNQYIQIPSQPITNTNNKQNQTFQPITLQFQPFQNILPLQSQTMKYPVQPQSLPINSTQQNFQINRNFPTMQNIFASQNQIKQPITQFYTNPPVLQNISNSNNLPLQTKPIDFNLMPNLLTTTNQQTLQTLQTVHDKQNGNPPNFNSMQNIFKTDSNTTLPPLQTSKSPEKKQNAFDLQKINYLQNGKSNTSPQNKTIFNTISGSKSNNNWDIFVSSFGTTQTGNIPIFQTQPIQPIQQINTQTPNFTKKKPSVQQDLI